MSSPIATQIRPSAPRRYTPNGRFSIGNSGWLVAESSQDFMQSSSLQPPQLLQICDRLLKRTRAECDRRLGPHAFELVGRDAKIAVPDAAVVESECARVLFAQDQLCRAGHRGCDKDIDESVHCPGREFVS